MAHRDRSAGHAFMYVNVKDLISQTQEIRKAAETGTPVETHSEKTHQFSSSSAPITSSEAVSTDQIKGNLERLQSLHHKLHAMLEELNKLTGKK